MKKLFLAILYRARFNSLLVLLVLLCSNLYAQRVVQRSFLSKLTGDSIKYKVWIPVSWSANKKYPSIYLNDYGALGNNGMLVAAEINNFINQFPKTVVVELVSGDMEHMDYNYDTGLVGPKGKAFISAIREELMPAIEKDFHTTKFKAFVGQSYSASYANYLFLNQPELFNAYVVLTPEQLKEDQPPFAITERLKAYYHSNETMYYISPAGKDIERRKKYANDIKVKTKVLDTTKFHFRYQLFEGADHNSIVSFALLPGLQFIFSRYDLRNLDSATDVRSAFVSKQQQLRNLYGLEIPKDSWAQSPFLDLAAYKKDKTGMDYIATYFRDSTSAQNSLMLFNTAYVYFDTFHDDTSAEKYFKMSIGAAKMAGSKRSMMNGYSWLATMYWDSLKNFNRAWETLQEAYDMTHSTVYKYKMGALSAATGKNINDGIEDLESFLDQPPVTFPEKEIYKKECAYLLLSKCYYKKKDSSRSRHYLNLSLATNKDYEPALQWKKQFEKPNN